MRKSRNWLGAFALAGIVYCGGVWPDSKSSAMPVTVRVLPVTSVTVESLDFGQFSAGTATVEAHSTITVVASPLIVYNIALGAGQHYGGTWRNVERSGGLVQYGLFQENGHEWGDGDFGGTYPWGRSLSALGTGTAQLHMLVGKLYVSTMSPSARPGIYQDIVTVTVYF